MLNIALPKGRLGMQVYQLLDEIGYGCAEITDEGSRKLIFENPHNDVRYFLVKPSDVAIYVEKGAADIGVVGKDILLENAPDVYELLDLGFGSCRMCVAAMTGYREDTARPLRVATKFTNITRTHYTKKNRDVEIIKLYGSIELAPIVGMSDVIVDLVETGATLRENGLQVVEEIVSISARLIANKSSFLFKEGQINRITAELQKGRSV
ncbi:MAG: ATP phosphoribosyltransferase [Eubacteriales bacterium]